MNPEGKWIVRRFLLFVVVVMFIAALAWAVGPDVKRYLRISRM